MLGHLFGLEAARRRALKRAPAGPLREYLAAPFPSGDVSCVEAPIVALDLEATGPDPKRHSILSMGLVQIEGMVIRGDSAWHQILRPPEQIPEDSVIVHQITDDRAASGMPLEEALPLLLEKLAGQAMLVHFGRIEQEFIDTACRELYGAPFLIPTIDTLELARRYLTVRNYEVQSGDLRLFNLRPRFNLPRYKAHNALNDALATAELFLAMAAEMTPAGKGRLRDYLTN